MGIWRADSKGRSKQTVRWAIATAVAFPQKSESILSRHQKTMRFCLRLRFLAKLFVSAKMSVNRIGIRQKIVSKFD